MDVAVLNPQDCLQNSFARRALISPQSMKRPKSHHRNRSNRSPPNWKKTLPPSRPREDPKLTAKNLVMGQVKILKRGEALAPKTEKVQKDSDLDLGSTDRLGPDPELVPSQIRLAEKNGKVSAFYAGSGFVVSPPPSSLPMPAFAKKSGVSANNDATSDLRRILRLDS